MDDRLQDSNPNAELKYNEGFTVWFEGVELATLVSVTEDSEQRIWPQIKPGLPGLCACCELCKGQPNNQVTLGAGRQGIQ